MVNKLPDELINFIDIRLFKIIDKHLNFYYKINFTPNILTTFSLISALLSVYAFYKDKYLLSSLLFILSYYFDCTDGKFARKYNMVTKFGSYYDHISDVFKVILLFIIMYNKSKNKFKKIIIPFIILFIFMMLYFECQEKIYCKYESPMLLPFNILIGDCKKYMKILKYLSPTFLILYFALIILFWKKL